MTEPHPPQAAPRPPPVPHRPASAPRHRRNGSQPNPLIREPLPLIEQLSPLERQWSTGDGLSSYDSFNIYSTTSISLSSFNASWTGAPTMTDLPENELPPTVLPSFHASLGSSSSLGMTADDPDVISSIIHDEARVAAYSRVLELCRTHPQHAAYANLDGWTALHHVCNRRGENYDVVLALVNAYPQALLEVDQKGWTPLHYACRFKQKKETVELLLKLHPDMGNQSVRIRDLKGRTPLWYAVRYEAPEGVVQMLLDIDSDSILEKDKTGESPLTLVWDSWAEKFEGKKMLASLLMQGGEPKSTEQVRQALQSSNKKFKTQWQTTNLFLKYHYGLKANGSSEGRTYRVLHATAGIPCHHTLFHLAKMLHPEQASELDESDLTDGTKTALHLAASSLTTGDLAKTVVLSLLELNPTAAQTKESINSALPLHLMVKTKNHWIHDGVRDVYQANPGAVREADALGMFPLHHAAAANARSGGQGGSIILQLLDLFPEAASHADQSGKFPLHHLAENGDEWTDEVEAIFQAHEAAVRSRAGDKLPLHLAAASPSASLNLLEPLLERHPRGARQTDRKGRLPLHLAVESGKSWEIIAAICDSYPDAVREPAGQWVALQIAAASDKTPSDLLKKLVPLYPGGAERKDDQGRFALHLACASGKLWNTGLEDVLLANPFANIIEDNKGMLPFHIAALLYCKDDHEKQDEKPVARSTPPRPANMVDVRRGTRSLSEFPLANIRRSSRSSSEGIRRTSRSMSVSEPDLDTPKVEVLFQLLMSDPNILPKY